MSPDIGACYIALMMTFDRALALGLLGVPRVR
jgi:hypothetical protein